MASTATPATSRELLARADEGWLGFRVAVAAMGTGAFARRTSAGWTYQALVAHVAAWHRATVRRLALFRDTGARAMLPELADDDAFNARVARETAATPPDELVAELEGSWAELRAAIASLSDAAVAAHGGWAAAVVAANTYDHYAEHQPELADAVPSTPRAVVDLIASAWERLRAAAAAVDLDAPPRAGWTPRGRLAHLAYWTSRIPAELPDRLAGARPPVRTVEANARIAAEAPGLDRTALLGRLERAYGDTVAALAALSPDDPLPPSVIGFIAVRTYEHWRGHAAELAEDAR